MAIQTGITSSTITASSPTFSLTPSGHVICTSVSSHSALNSLNGNLTIDGAVTANEIRLKGDCDMTANLSVRLDDAYFSTDEDDLFASEESFVRSTQTKPMKERISLLFGGGIKTRPYRLLSVLGSESDANEFFKGISNPVGEYCIEHIRKLNGSLGNFPYSNIPMGCSSVTVISPLPEDLSTIQDMTREYCRIRYYNEPHNNRVTAQIIFSRVFAYGGQSIYLIPMLISLLFTEPNMEKEGAPVIRLMTEYRKALLDAMEKSDNPELEDMILINMPLFKSIGMLGDIQMLTRLKNLAKLDTYFSVTADR